MTVPAGEYRLGTFSLAFDDPGGGPRWSFIFSDDGGTHDYKWYRVEKGGTVEIDPVGKLVLQTGVEESRKVHLRPAMTLTFSPGSTPATGS